LKPLTIEVEFVRNNKTVFIATTWAGYVGVLTGMAPDRFSVSVNFRIVGDSYWENVKHLLTYSWPIGFLVREVLDDPNTDFDAAVRFLANSTVIAPVYFTICGIEEGQGTLITRRRESEDQRLTLETDDDGLIVQTNIDHYSEDEDDDILYSIERRSLARAYCSSLMSSGNVCESELWEIMSKFPITNSLTVSGTYMVPSKGLLRTLLPQDYELSIGFRPCKNPAPLGGVQRKTCTVCSAKYIEELNVKGFCGHVGKWHETFDDCSYMKCAMGLKTNIGYRHWSCCYQTELKLLGHSPCTKSGPHQS